MHKNKVIKPKISSEIEKLIQALENSYTGGQSFIIEDAVHINRSTNGICGIALRLFDYEHALRIIKALKSYYNTVSVYDIKDAQDYEYWFPTTFKTKRFSPVTVGEAKEIRLDFLRDFLKYLNEPDDKDNNSA